jgi:iron complex outermembrane recepter protein
MAARTRFLVRPPQKRVVAIAALLALAGDSVLAQGGTTAGTTAGTTVTVTARTLPSISGFADAELARAPLDALSLGAASIAERGARSLAELARIDAGASDAYAAEGYWASITVRGFVLDARYNFRRDGLPINAESWIPLANKERVEILKGTSGAQAGTSAPGGLVNYVVKRPTLNLREARVEVRDRGGVSLGVDLSQRLGRDAQHGLRINAGHETLRPAIRSADGRAHWLALAADTRLGADTLLEAEFETSRRSQPSVPGFSLQGGTLPDADSIDPRTNLNNQAWSLPVVFAAQTASLRLRQRLAADWRLTAHGAVQRLESDDRIAFPFGCFDGASNVYYADRYCPDGSLDLYDFRSEGERRRVAAAELRLEGSAQWAGVPQHLALGVLTTREQARFQPQAFNYAGPGSVRGDVPAPAAPDATEPNTDRDERSTELFARHRAELGARWQLWSGLRHSRLERDSVRTDGSRATAYRQTFTTPWLALTHHINDSTTLFASAGQGVESEVVPNRSRYSNRGQALPALRSKQIELGLKQSTNGLAWSVVAFDIQRPQATDRCDDANPPLCERVVGEQARHRGLNATAQWRLGAFELQGSAQTLRARLAGQEPANLPRHSLRVQVARSLPLAGGEAQLQAALAHEGSRAVVAGEALRAPAWTRIDLGAQWRGTVGAQAVTARIGIDNVADTRAWRETPYQFGHAYLFPLAARSWRASLSTAF